MKFLPILTALCLSYANLQAAPIQNREASVFTCGDQLVDERDGQTYKTVAIGDQCWMAENLNYGEPIAGLGSKKEPCPELEKGKIKKFCYDDSRDQCASMGALYCWEQASQIKWEDALNDSTYQGACPAGWILPGNADFNKLRAQYAGESLLEGGTSGFNMSLSGYRYRGGRYDDKGQNGRLWSTFRPGTASSPGGKGANFLHLSPSGTSILQQKYDQAFSVRCIQK